MAGPLTRIGSKIISAPGRKVKPALLSSGSNRSAKGLRGLSNVIRQPVRVAKK